MSPAALSTSAASGTGRGILQTRFWKNSSGYSQASACTSWGRASVTAGTRLRRVGQDAHGGEGGGHDLLGAVDPVPVLRDRPKRIVDGDITVVLRLQLLQHGVRAARGEDVAGQQQHGDAVDRGKGRAGDHVGRARTDGGGAGEGLQTILLP